MPKKILQDIKKVKYEIKEELPKDLPRSKIDRPESRLFSHPTFYNPEPIDKNSDGPKYTLWIVALISVVFLFFAVSFLFSGAKILVTPKTYDFDLSDSFSASRDSDDGNLSFSLVSIAGEESKIVQVEEEKDVSIKAEGTVIIYNTFSSSPQTLNIDTRLEGSNGKIYKTKEKVVVPGAGGEDKPGSIEVGIYGAEAGAEYNSEPLDFKIYGFKGTSKYDKFYARSKGNIAGGLTGKLHQVPDDERDTLVKELEVVLKERLLKNIIEQIPTGFALFEGAVFLEVENKDFNFTSSDINVPVVVKGTLYGFLFNEKKLTKKIVEANVSNYDGSDVFISNLRDLDFSFISKDIVSFKDIKNINFSLSGNAKIVWSIDTVKLASDLLGKNKKEFSEVLSQYSNIASADMNIKPAWKNSFPDKSKDIKIIVNYPQ
ncbi:hypothetical protein KKA39_03190 [Patescibacteria group bacterium]|nr:hypothetical protein [Patescibacteria group bacterium]MBU1728280.1 hypothetical protein [Patescibacteria group bacterium]